LTRNILQEADELLAIGCFCIGTNQVDLDYAASRGVILCHSQLKIPVFNSPFSNSRSVGMHFVLIYLAELMIGIIIALARQVGDANNQGQWQNDVADGHQIRGKILGIIGYGHIGSQLSVLAESFGMTVIFYDILQIMPLGSALPLDSLEEVLSQADFVSLHVPETPETKMMIGKTEIELMKKGSYLINASRGSVVNIDELAAALRAGHLAGAAVVSKMD
jgi:D-3-phosphoglycerate dehydrogenase